MARRHPASGAVINYLQKNPAARWGAGCAMVLLAVEIIWFAGFSFRLGRGAEASQLVATGRPTSVAAAQTPRPTNAAQALATTPPAQPSASSPPAQASATLRPAQGDHFVLYYDDTALYFKNASGKDRSINPAAFERLDSAGNPLNRWEGWRWGQIYPIFRAGYCEVAQIIDYKSHLDPPECYNRDVAVRTPSLSDPGIFWTTQKGSEQFRVLWSNAEVGRCTIVAKHCDVYLP
jgi:hypothetical protein